jgi:hypothetical protein
MRPALAAYEDLTLQIFESVSGNGNSTASALPQRSHGFIFGFLTEFAFESNTDWALHRADTSVSILAHDFKNARCPGVTRKLSMTIVYVNEKYGSDSREVYQRAF